MFQALASGHSALDNARGTDKTVRHAYGKLYECILEPYRERARRVLEIGVYSGASVYVFAGYFEKAHVTGVDIDLSKLLPTYLDHPRITYIENDATHESLTRKLNHEFYDVIIDDGSHDLVDQVCTARMLIPYLRPGGMYVIEDIRDARSRYVFELFAREHSVVLCWYDMRNVNDVEDDVVAVFRKGS